MFKKLIFIIYIGILFLLSHSTVRWVESSRADFSDGFADQNLYVSYRTFLDPDSGAVEWFKRFDLDLNGYPDFVSADGGATGNMLRIWLMGPTGFLRSILLPIPNRGGNCLFADLNLDGYPELIHSGFMVNKVVIYWNNRGTLSVSDTSLYDNFVSEAIFSADVDFDGWLDLIISGDPHFGGRDSICILWGRGVGSHGWSVSTRTCFALPGRGCHNIECADIDSDGDLDIVAPAMTGSGPLTILENTGGRTFRVRRISLPPAGAYLHGLSVGDLDNDGDVDIVVTHGGGERKAWVLLNDGSGDFPTVITLNPGSCYGGNAIEDVTCDSLIDIVFFRSEPGGQIIVCPNIGPPTYFNDLSCYAVTPFSMEATGGIVIDADRDGNKDIFANGGRNYAFLFWGPRFSTCDSFAVIADHHGTFNEPGNILNRSKTAYYESNIYDLGVPYGFSWGIVNWISFDERDYLGGSLPRPTGAKVVILARSGDSPTPDITWTDWDTLTDGACIPSSLLRKRYFQYRAELNYQTAAYLPWLERIEFEFDLSAVESVWFAEETDCNNRNIVRICYTLLSDDLSNLFSVVIRMSADSGSTWTVPLDSIWDHEGDIDDSISVGIHCFYWELDFDLPDTEGLNWALTVQATHTIDTFHIELSDTAFAPLDSRPPLVSINCPETTIYFDDTVIISWHVEDLFWKSDPCSIRINICGRETSFIVADTTFEFIMPESSLCDSAVFIVAARDSFCNWGYDTCILRFIPEEPTGYIAISFGDTISHPCRNVVVPLLVDSADCNIDKLVITFTVDTEVVHPLRFVPTIHPCPDSVKMRYAGTFWEISFFWSTRVRVSSGIAGFLHLNVDCATNAGYFSIIDIISAFAHRASVLWRDGTVIVDYKINPWLTTIHFRDIVSDMTAEVTFGASYTATDFYDPWIDLLHLTPPPGRIDVWLDIDDPAHPAVRKLFRDIRDMVPENVWTIIINHPSSTLVHWSPASLGEGFYTLNGWLDMRTDTQYFATPYETLNISWRLPRLRLDTIRILSGWNIISLPLRSPKPSVDFIFKGTFAGPYEFDPVGATFFIPEIARIGVGYCINSPVDTNIIFVGTIYNRYQRYVYRGWNILGCPSSAVDTADITTSGTRILNIFEFDEASRCYVIPDSLRPGKGYWFLMSNNGKIYVPR